MRRLFAAGGVVAGLAGGASAQQSMPGTPVGTPLVVPVGNRLPQAVPNVGAPIGTGPGGIPSSISPIGPTTTSGKSIDLKNVVTPYPGMPQPEPTFWEKLEARWMTFFGSDRPAVKPPNWTPGLARRNRERREEQQEEAMRRR